MPTFTAVALERLLEPRDSKSTSDSKLERSSSSPVRASGANGDDSKPASVHNRKPSIPLPPPVHPNGVRRSSASSRTPEENEKEKSPWPKFSPVYTFVCEVAVQGLGCACRALTDHTY